jgi:hypothetical protein
MRARRYLLIAIGAALVWTMADPDRASCKEVEITGYWGMTLFSKNRVVTLDDEPWTSDTGYFLWGARVERGIPWWRLYAFIDYRYSPHAKRLKERPTRSLRMTSSSQVVSVGVGRYLVVGQARLGLKAGLARVHDTAKMVQYEETEREADVRRSTSGNGLVLGADLLLPVFEWVGVSLSYNYLYRSRTQVGTSLPLPDF